MSFLDDKAFVGISWQAFERLLARLLFRRGFSAVRLVGQSADGGADILAHAYGKRWLFQVKRWSSKVGISVIDRTVAALLLYSADIPVVVSIAGFDVKAREQQKHLLAKKIPLQLWDRPKLLEFGSSLSAYPEPKRARDYQEEAIRALLEAFDSRVRNAALVVLATGLGKTFVAAEFFRRAALVAGNLRVLVVAHTNDLVYQLERSFWPFISDNVKTTVWNGIERPSDEHLANCSLVFACLPTLGEAIRQGADLDGFDIVIIDECHHVGGAMYESLIQMTNAGKSFGPFLLGLTATPWRADKIDIGRYFGLPLISIDLVAGLKRGFLANVDYRMFTDNVDWTGLRDLPHGALSPRQINRRLFINQWDDAVVDAFQSAWGEQPNPRAIVFCGTIEHAIMMRDRINARQFCSAQAVFSGSGSNGSHKMSGIERNRIMADFHDQRLDVICAVDIFNEGIDVPDVNILVFQRVTHSRRIFIQQLGRGLRLADGKEKVIVLDFVSDIRRFAAGLDLQRQLESDSSERPVRLNLSSTIQFRRLGGNDPNAESFLREWLEDVAAIEDAGEDASVLRYPPHFEAQ